MHLVKESFRSRFHAKHKAIPLWHRLMLPPVVPLGPPLLVCIVLHGSGHLGTMGRGPIHKNTESKIELILRDPSMHQLLDSGVTC